MRIPELSLRQKLPLLLVGLIGATLLVAGGLGYADVREYSRATTEERLRSVTMEFARLSQVGLVNRQRIEETLAAGPLVQASVREGVVDSAALSLALEEYRLPSDSGLPVLLIAADKRRVFSIGLQPSEPDPLPEPPLESERSYGVVRPMGDQMLYWYVVPVPGPGTEPSGWIAQRRRIGNPEAGGAIESFIGSGIRVAIGQIGDDHWVDFGGQPESGPPEGFPRDTPFTFTRADGSDALAVVSNIASTPWVLLLHVPMTTVHARSQNFLRRALAAGAVLILIAVIVAWGTGRQLTEPLKDLASAADDMAAGRYGRQVEVRGSDEIARLARAFNSMAAQVAASDDALRHRLLQETALAERLQEANAKAESAREQAQRANRAKSEFLATMSHEIRTPINAVMGYTELLKSGIPDPPTKQQEDYLERIDRSSQLLSALVNDVLDFSHIESGRMQLEVRAGPVTEVIRSAVSALEPEVGRKGIQVTSCGDAETSFWGDRRRVEQILLNLLSNAVKFTPEGGSISISHALEAEGPSGARSSLGPWVRIAVEDTGVGIDQRGLDTLFEPFAQGDASLTRKHRGIGLGLSISHRLASMMGGQISVETALGKGSRFTLWLPGSRVRAQAVAAI